MSFNDNTRKFADIFKAGMTLGDNGVVTIESGTIEKTYEGTDITPALVKEIQDHRDLMISGAGLALGEIGIKAFKGDKKLEQVSVETKVHKDILGAVVTRMKEYPNAQNPGGDKIVKHGVLTSKWQVNGAGNRGQLKLVRQHLNAEAAKVLSK